jgi:hypothetical protein
MYTPTPDEKIAAIMIYSQSSIIRGDAVVKETVRVSVWMRTEAAPEFIHLLNPQVILANNSATKVFSYSEIYYPTSQALAYHLAPPLKDPLDFDESEINRIMQPVTVFAGPFLMNGSIRISTKVEMGTSIASSRTAWMSLYNVKITNPYLPQMGEIQTPMLLIRPGKVSFALQSQ